MHVAPHVPIAVVLLFEGADMSVTSLFSKCARLRSRSFSLHACGVMSNRCCLPVRHRSCSCMPRRPAQVSAVLALQLLTAAYQEPRGESKAFLLNVGGSDLGRYKGVWRPMGNPDLLFEVLRRIAHGLDARLAQHLNEPFERKAHQFCPLDHGHRTHLKEAEGQGMVQMIFKRHGVAPWR